MQLSKKATLKCNLNRWNTRRSQLFRQYSRVQNITKKDRNTKFFHAYVSSRMRKKVIRKIKVNGRMVKGRYNVAKKTDLIFLTTSLNPIYPISPFHGTLSSVYLPNKLSSWRHYHQIRRSLVLLEIVIYQRHYDGFNLKFILKMWDIVGPDILSFAKAFFQNGSFPTSINTT